MRPSRCGRSLIIDSTVRQPARSQITRLRRRQAWHYKSLDASASGKLASSCLKASNQRYKLWTRRRCRTRPRCRRLARRRRHSRSVTRGGRWSRCEGRGWRWSRCEGTAQAGYSQSVGGTRSLGSDVAHHYHQRLPIVHINLERLFRIRAEA